MVAEQVEQGGPGLDIELAAFAERPARELSLGNRRRVELARALASRPSLIFLDEVLSGLTPGEIEDAIRMVRAIRDEGATIVFVEHVMRAVMALSREIHVLHHGELIASGAPDEVVRDPAVLECYLGEAAA